MPSDRSSFVGPRLRRLRREIGLTQAVMAEELGVSASYIALIERNHRPISADLLIKLADRYSVDVAGFAGSEDKTAEQLEGALADPAFADLGVTREDLRDLAAVNPALAEAVAALYQSHRASQRAMMEARASVGDAGDDPVEEARNFIDAGENYFPMLDEAGEAIAIDLQRRGGHFIDALRGRLNDRHGLDLRILPEDIMVGALRRLDRHRGHVAISEALDGASRKFQAALQLVYLELSDALNETAAKGDFSSESGRKLTRAALANYAAAAIILPYQRFFEAANELRYDLEAMSRRFSASFEQIAHRLTTLQRPGADGVPFFFIRIDAAGNVSKRFSGGVFPFARYGGSCPLWNVHKAFREPRKILTQIIELPDGDAFFSIARTVHGGAGGYHAPQAERAVALGCDLRHADKLVYADGLSAEAARTPIGVTCRLCPRTACASRATPPLERRLIIDEYRSMATPFSFAFD